jgi:ABC-type transporter Mla maintaining outer membrane lipid asymmetry permease subunit MlaE
VLTAYWLFSGYGLRAWRSLAALISVMAVFAAAFKSVGITGSTSYWKSLLFAFRSTISLTDPSVKLTAWGGLFQATLRLIGPVLLALTLLALRGRVKR